MATILLRTPARLYTQESPSMCEGHTLIHSLLILFWSEVGVLGYLKVGRWASSTERTLETTQSCRWYT